MYTTKTMLGIAAAAFIAASASAQESALFTYKGFQIGESSSDFAQRLPLWTCTDERCSYNLDSCSKAHGISGEVFRSRLRECHTGTSFGGAMVESGTAMIREGRVIRINLQISRSFYRILSDALTVAYGQATDIESVVYQNAYGATTQGHIHTWLRSDARLVLQEIGETRELSSVSITAPGEDAVSAKRRAEGAKKAARDF